MQGGLEELGMKLFTEATYELCHVGGLKHLDTLVAWGQPWDT